MIQLAAQHGPPRGIRYIGIDLFESRSGCARGLTVKEAHKALSVAGVHPRLVPGDPYAALCRTANALGSIDLVVISADQDADAMSRAWLYLPRILRQDSAVFLEEIQSAEQSRFRQLPLGEIQARARECVQRVRRAA